MATAVTSDAQQLVVFSLADEEYALPIARVQEIIRYAEPRAVASQTAWVRGVISLRGKIVPVCDLATRLGFEAELAEEAKIVIVETDAGTAGVIVDEVEEVCIVEQSQLELVPGAGSDLIEVIARIEERLVVILSPGGLLSGLEPAEGRAAA